MSTSPDKLQRAGDRTFVRRLFLLLLVGLLAVAAWQLSDLLLLLFGAILVAVILRSIADPLHRWLRLPEGLALALAGVLLVGSVAAGVLLFGAQISQQFGLLIERIPGAVTRLSGQLNLDAVLEWIKTNGSATTIGNFASRLVSWSTTLFSVAASLLVVLVAGAYLASDPRLYRDGFLKLVPPQLQPRIEATLDDAGQALRLWLVGQLVAMVIVGVLTTLGLMLIGVPSALALGLIAGLAEFIPYVGPITAAIPALLVASTQGWDMVWWTLAVYVVIQQFENNILIPLVARQTVSIAPAVGVFAILAVGIVFGPLGLLLAFPLTVVLDVAIRRLYVLDTLDQEVEILGEPAIPAEARDEKAADRST